MKAKLQITIMLLLAVATNAFLYSQTKYSLNDCIESALRNNYDLLFQTYQKDYDAVLQKSAFGAYLPSLSGSAGYSRTITNQDSPYLNNYSMQLQANMLIYDGGKREANHDIADNSAKLTELQTQYLAEQLKLSVYTQFVNIIRQQEIVKARKEDIESSKIQLANMQARYEAGVIAVDMVLSQAAELGNKEIQLLYAEIDVNTSKQTLLTIMGQDPSADAEFADETIPSEIDDADVSAFRSNIGDLQNSISLAFKNRIDYSSEQTAKHNAELSKSAADGSYYPTLSASLNYGWSAYNFDDFSDNLGGSVGISLNVPIFNNYNTDLQSQQYELSYQRQNTAILKLEQSIKAEVQTAYFNLQSSEKALQISETSLTAAAQNFESNKEKVNTGIATITDYITANTQFITAQINKITATYVYLNARRNLLFTIGRYN
ncbi:MAG: TolC family protein [Ignavibacteria bacterium]|jgi:outer membrane protein|nr:TolC family protein [Ignavibacteria bacterium]